MNVQKIILAFVLGISLIGCKKEETTILKPRQTVLDSIQRDFTETISNGSPGAYAVGYQFNITSNGVIDQLALCTPSIGSYKIIIKNFDTSTKDSVTINITAADTGRTIFQGITPMVVNAGNDFQLTFNDLDKPQYQYLRTNGMNQVYGNIGLYRYVYQAQATSSSIDGLYGESVNYTFGGVGFTFAKD
jgi:hypothetical protein